jgi:hypothetical protein
MLAYTTTAIIELIFLDEKMGLKGVWILQKGFYEGNEACQKPFMCVYLFHFTNKRKQLEDVCK